MKLKGFKIVEKDSSNDFKLYIKHIICAVHCTLYSEYPVHETISLGLKLLIKIFATGLPTKDETSETILLNLFRNQKSSFISSYV